MRVPGLADPGRMLTKVSGVAVGVVLVEECGTKRAPVNATAIVVTNKKPIMIFAT